MVRARKRFGQHFLASPGVLARIADALDILPGDPVLEIGPGQGALTRQLLARGGRVTAIEIDRDLAHDLRSRFPDLRLVEGDALEMDWGQAVDRPEGGYLLAGNIPYNITTPLLEQALAPPLPARMVFLVQKEVADRITARPGTRAYGGLTVGVAALAATERLLTVPPGAFVPPPRVDSAVIRLVPLAQPLVEPSEVTGFRRCVSGLFGFRRKQLGRALRELTGWAPSRVAALLEQRGIDPAVRAETLEVPEFVGLFRSLIDGGWSER